MCIGAKLCIPFTRSGNAYPSRSSYRAAAVTLVTDRAWALSMKANFASWDRYLLNEQTAMVIAGPACVTAARALSWSHHTRNISGCDAWLTPLRNLGFTCSVEPYVPNLYGGTLRNAQSLYPRTQRNCSRRKADYPVATKWYAHAMPYLPIMQRFDFFIKVDVDVCMRSTAPLVDYMVLDGSYFAHTGFIREDACLYAGSAQFMQKTAGHFGRHLPTEFEVIPFSNFIAGWLPLFERPGFRSFATAWRDFELGWVYRWGDQQYWMLAMWRGNVEHQVLNAQFMRDVCFEHKTRTHCMATMSRDDDALFCQPPPAGFNDSLHPTWSRILLPISAKRRRHYEQRGQRQRIVSSREQ